MIEVLLLKSVEKLGKIGSIVKVAPGYAKNFLIPQKFAVVVNDKILKKFEEKKHKFLEEEQKNDKIAHSLKNALADISFSLAKKTIGATNKLYGNISNREISDMIIENVNNNIKSKIDIDYFISPKKINTGIINTCGEYKIKLNLFGDISVEMTLNVSSLSN